VTGWQVLAAGGGAGLVVMLLAYAIDRRAAKLRE
jgi:hypothetical protein